MIFLQPLLRYLAPYDCIGCGRENSILCNWCRADEGGKLPSRCYKCQAVTADSAVCVRCRRTTVLRHVWVAAQYQGVAEKLVKRLKFNHAQEAAGVMASMIDDLLPYLAEHTVISYVPTATTRIRRRGYDQAKLIASQLAGRRRRVCRGLLARVGQTRQVGATRAERQRQLRAAYHVPHPDRVAGAHILLIDDVLTTGATLEEAAHTLKLAGAAQVDAAVFACRPLL